MRSLLLRPGDVADLLNTQKESQRVGQHKETEEYV